MEKIKVGLAATGDPMKLDTQSIAGFIELAGRLDCEVVRETNGFFSIEDAAIAAEGIRKEEPDMIVVLCQSFTWFGESIKPFLDLEVPLLLWAVEEPLKEGPLPFNSMTGCNLFASVIHACEKDGRKRMKWLYGVPEMEQFRRRFTISVNAVRVIKSLKNKKLALIGGIAEGFVNLAFDKEKLSRRFGIKVEELSLDEVFRRMEQCKPEMVNELKETIRSGAANCTADEKRLETSCKAILALTSICEEYECDGMAVACWPEFQERMDIFPCLAFGYLCGHGIAVGCEGDLLGTLSMIALNSITERPSALMDFVQVRPEENRVMWWHCGIGLCEYADDQGYEIQEYATMPGMPKDPGVICDMVLKPGRVTVLRFHENGDKMFVLSADVIPSEERGHTGVRAWYSNFTMQGKMISATELTNTILMSGLPHHFAVGGKDAEEALVEAAHWLGTRVIEKIPYRDYL